MIRRMSMLWMLLVGCSLTLTGCPPSEQPQKSAGEAAKPAAKAPADPAKAAKPQPVTSTGGGLRNVGATVSPATPPAPSRGPLLDVGPLLTLDDVRKVTGYQGEMTEKALAGIPRSSSYDSTQFKPADTDISIGITVQAWTFDKAEDAIREYQRHLKSYPEVTEQDEIGNKSFRALRSGTQYINWLDQANMAVVSVTCNNKICDWDKLVELAKLSAERAASLKAPAPAEAEPAEAEPAEAEPAEPETAE